LAEELLDFRVLTFDGESEGVLAVGGLGVKVRTMGDKGFQDFEVAVGSRCEERRVSVCVAIVWHFRKATLPFPLGRWTRRQMLCLRIPVDAA
jgi:hypothetical protein